MTTTSCSSRARPYRAPSRATEATVDCDLLRRLVATLKEGVATPPPRTLQWVTRSRRGPSWSRRRPSHSVTMTIMGHEIPLVEIAMTTVHFVRQWVTTGMNRHKPVANYVQPQPPQSKKSPMPKVGDQAVKKQRQTRFASRPLRSLQHSPTLSSASSRSGGAVLCPSSFLRKMLNQLWIALLLVVSWHVCVLDASAGDADPRYRACVKECEETGCVGEKCFPHCKCSSNCVPLDGPWYMQEPLYLKWKQWDCQGDCRYHCMIDREEEREALGIGPVKYHGKWPFKRVYGMQEPVSVVFSALNLAMHFHGWLSFFIVLYYKLPLKQDKKAYYEFASLWHIYGLLSMNSWFWSAVFHSRDVDLTEKLDYSSAVALLGYSFILSILRSFNVKAEAARVMVAAPLLAFITTHIMFLNFYKMDYGWNMKVCVVMAAGQLLIWAIFAGVTRHPSRWKLWLVVVAGGLAMLLEIYDFPPYQGLVDAHALWHATTIPLTYIWWSFIRDDAEFQTSNLLKKAK